VVLNVAVNAERLIKMDKQYLRVATKAMHQDSFVFLFHAPQNGDITVVTPFIERADKYTEAEAILLVESGAIMFEYGYVLKFSEKRVCGQVMMALVLLQDHDGVKEVFEWDPRFCEATRANLFIHEYDYMHVNDFYESNRQMVDFHAQVKEYHKLLNTDEGFNEPD